MKNLAHPNEETQSNVIPFPQWKTLPNIDMNSLLSDGRQMGIAFDPDGHSLEIRDDRNKTIWIIRRVDGNELFA